MRVTTKRIFRAILVLLLVLLGVYLVILGTANPQTIDLLFFVPLPTAWVIGSALLIGFIVGWVSLVGRVLTLQRETRALRQRLIRAGLETPPPAPTRTGRRAPTTNETTRP